VLAVVQADWWKMGQLAAGDTFRFIQPTDQAAAEQLNRQRQWLASVAAAVNSGSAAEPFPLDVESEPQAVTDGVIKVIPGDEALDAPSLTFKLVSLTPLSLPCRRISPDTS
jgi:urea carboxylase